MAVPMEEPSERDSARLQDDFDAGEFEDALDTLLTQFDSATRAGVQRKVLTPGATVS